ncbi:hypothetical protein IVY21_05040 [Salmonella enterica subsp. enterica serovar Worthington]|nr:hypothetical protein [Salmonella enterica subsp. enterica serovar Worthington]
MPRAGPNRPGTGNKEIGQCVNTVLTDVNANHHTRAQQLFDLAPFDAKRYFRFGVFLIHIDQRAAFCDVLQLFLIYARMVIWFMDNF